MEPSHQKSSMVVFAEKKIEYIELMSGLRKPGTAAHAALLADATAGLLQYIRNSKVCEDDAIDVAAVLTPALEESQVHSVMAAIDAKVNLSRAPGTDLKQTNFHLDSHLTPDGWSLFGRTDVPAQQRLLGMASQMLGLGLLNANERTFAYAAALATHADYPSKAELLVHTRDLKVYLKACTNASFLRGPSVYKKDPEDLLRSHPEVYKQAYPTQGPVPSTLNDAQRIITVKGAPCRNTRAGCEALRPTANANGMRQLMQSPAPRGQQLFVRSPSQVGDQCPIVMCGQPGSVGQSQPPNSQGFSDASIECNAAAPVHCKAPLPSPPRFALENGSPAAQPPQSVAASAPPSMPSQGFGAGWIATGDGSSQSKIVTGGDASQPKNSIASITAAIKHKIISGHAGLDKLETEGEDADMESTEGSDACDAKLVLKKPSGKVPRHGAKNKKKANAKSKAKTDAKVKGIGKGKGATDDLKFRTFTKPRYWRDCTIYNDQIRKQFRIKEAPGRRDEKYVAYRKSTQKEAWALVTKHLLSLY